MAITHLQPDAAHAFQRVLFYSLVVVIVMTALNLLHVPLTAFAFVSGAVAIGVGFGAQNIVNNFIAGQPDRTAGTPECPAHPGG